MHISLQAGSSPEDIERVEHLGAMRAVELAAQQHLAQLTYVSGMFVGVEGRSAVLDDQANTLRLYCSLLKPETQVTTMPLWLMSALDTLFLGKKMRRTLQMMQVLQQVGEFGDPSEANRILGAPTTTLRAWCEQQRLHAPGDRTSPASQTHPTANMEGEA